MLNKCVDELLLRGQEDWVSVWDILDVVRNIAKAESGSKEREASLKVIRILLESGWMAIGEVSGGRFEKWDLDPKAAINRVASTWNHYPNPRQMMYEWWLDNTPKGNLRASELAKRTPAA